MITRNRLQQLSLAGALALALGAAGTSRALAQAATSGTMTVRTPAAGSPASGAAAATDADLPPDADKLTFNFQGVPLKTVLDYMSRAGGFVIVGNQNVGGTVNIVSHQPVNRDEAVALLISVLYDKGYAAIRNDRQLKIVPLDEARFNTKINIGSDFEKIPNNDEIVVQIMPMGHLDASQVINDIRPLLPDTATITANASSNAIVMNDTQSSIRRVAELIHKLDLSVADISQLKVFPLTYADAKDTAALITQIFAVDTSAGGGAAGGRGGRGGGGRGGRGGGGGGQQFFQFLAGAGGGGGGSASPAMQANSRVTAAADERTNAVIVGASKEMMPGIQQLIDSVDKSTGELTVVRVFPLTYANSTDMATQITSIFSATGANTQVAGGRGARGGARGGRGGFGGAATTANANQSQREKAASTVLAVADTRTNSVIVSATDDVMEQVTEVVHQLDQNDAKAKKVVVIKVQNGADPASIASVVQGMFGGSATGNRSTTNRAGTTTNRNTTTRNTTGARGGTGGTGATGGGGTTGGGGRTGG